MSLPVLDIPLQNQARRPKPYLRVKQIKEWIHSLPTANTRKTVHLLIEQAKTINQSRYPVNERVQLLDELRPIARQLLLTLKQQLKRAQLPLSQKEVENYESIQSILRQMADGYKIIVSEMVRELSPREHDHLVLREAIYLSIQYMARQILEAYLVYREEPPRTWQEIHQLYLYAENHDLLALPIDDPYPDFNLPVHYTIDLVYKRLLLLSVSEPYHLMHNEAEDVYYLVSAWTSACNLLPLAGVIPEEEYVCDLASDHAPRYMTSEVAWTARDARIIDIDEVKKRLDLHLQHMLTTLLNTLDEDDGEHNTLVLRHQRDMLLRLADAWHGALKRKTTRDKISGKVSMASGLNSAHYYLSKQHDFTPEMDELRIRFYSEEVEPTVFSIAYETAMRKDRFHLNRDYAINPWWQNNASKMGAALACTTATECTQIKVGEVVAYNNDETGSGVRWQVGVVRWLKILTDTGMDLGIMNIAISAVPVASKALKGPGMGTDYFRSLLIPKQVSLQQQRSIIVPASVYDIDTVLSINMKRRLFYIKLSRLLLSTSSFAQFEFEVLEQPPLDIRVLSD